MPISVPSFGKINLGLRIGPLRPDGFHELRTVYQTIALHDWIRVSVGRGVGIEILCEDPRVPTDSANTCYRIVDRAMQALKARGRVTIEIEKRLPVQGGLGGASGNAVAALIGLEKALGKELSGADKLRIAAEVGSDLPLFLIGGTVLGVGRGEEVYPLPDLGSMACVVATPEIAVSTPKAFAEWDGFAESQMDRQPGNEEPFGRAGSAASRRRRHSGGKQVPRLRSVIRPAHGGTSLGMTGLNVGATDVNSGMTEFDTVSNTNFKTDFNKESKLTSPAHSDRMLKFSREISAWLSAGPETVGRRRSGVSARGGGRAENLLLDLVRTGIENDFERVVFPQFPELREVKSVLERAGARYGSLSGSGSAIYGLFDSRAKAAAAAKRLIQSGTPAVVTSTLTRRQYWRKLVAFSF
jgi:4-diphosphocytidyl-2-C-methyl-D-erythritol kinase